MFNRNQIDWLLDSLGGQEEPLGLFFDHRRPEGGVGPAHDKTHDCVMKYVRLARTKKVPAWVSRERFGCQGIRSQAGFQLPPPEAMAAFVTSGLPGQEGERYLPAPASMHRFWAAQDLRPAPADYLIIKPLNQFLAGEEAQVVIFFARPEALSGLIHLAYYALDDHAAVLLPFGPGCSGISSWPLRSLRQGEDKVVVGGTDISCRPYLETDELSLAAPAPVFRKMLAKAPESFLSGASWSKVRKKIDLSRRMWSRKKA